VAGARVSDVPDLLAGAFAPIVTCALAVAASHLAWRWRIAPRWVECPLRVAGGLAVVVLVMRLLVQAMPGAQAATVVLVVLAAAAGVAVARAVVRAGGRLSRPGYVVWTYVAAALALIALRLWPAVAIGHLTPFEGTGNHDELYYVFVAERLLHESVATMAAVPHTGTLLPFDAILPRVGAESFIVLYAHALGMTTAMAYPVASVLGSLLWAAATSAIVMSATGTNRVLARVAGIALVVASPQVAGIVANNNLAMLFGSAFVGPFVWALDRALARAKPRPPAVLAALCGAAALACYVEILPTLLVAGSVVAGLAAWRRRMPIRRLLAHVAAVAAIGVACYPLLAWDAPITLARHMTARLTAGAWDSLLAGSDPVGVLLRTFTLDPSIPGAWRRRWSWLVAGSIVVALCMTGRRAWLAVAPLMAAGVLALASALALDYHYGELKGIQTLAMPLAALVALVAVRWMDALRPTRLVGVPSAHPASLDRLGPAIHLAFLACGAVALAFQCYAFAADFARYTALAQAKHLTRDMLALATLGPVLPADAATYVSADLGEYPFLRSRWIAYELRDRPLIFHPRYHGGGYLRGLEIPYVARFARSRFVLARSDRGPLLPPSQRPVFRNGTFQLVDLSKEPFVELAGGFHDDEGSFRWMAGDGEIWVFGPRPRALRIEFVGRFDAIAGESAVVVKSGEQTERFELPNGQRTIVVPVPRDGDPVISIHSLLDAKSPQELGLSGDWRALSFRIGRVSIE